MKAPSNEGPVEVIRSQTVRVLPFASSFAGGALIGGVAVAWLTAYVLQPISAEWLHARHIPFQIGLVATGALTIFGTVVFSAASAALLALRTEQALPAGLNRRCAIAGTTYSALLLGGIDALERAHVDLDPHDVLTPARLCILAVSVAVVEAVVVVSVRKNGIRKHEAG